ncbi:hypothetical protein GGR50DRAFT_317965, partial [Xylaria sp. CBS 124048]
FFTASTPTELCLRSCTLLPTTRHPPFYTVYRREDNGIPGLIPSPTSNIFTGRRGSHLPFLFLFIAFVGDHKLSSATPNSHSKSTTHTKIPSSYNLSTVKMVGTTKYTEEQINFILDRTVKIIPRGKTSEVHHRTAREYAERFGDQDFNVNQVRYVTERYGSDALYGNRWANLVRDTEAVAVASPATPGSDLAIQHSGGINAEEKEYDGDDGGDDGGDNGGGDGGNDGNMAICQNCDGSGMIPDGSLHYGLQPAMSYQASGYGGHRASTSYQSPYPIHNQPLSFTGRQPPTTPNLPGMYENSTAYHSHLPTGDYSYQAHTEHGGPVEGLFEPYATTTPAPPAHHYPANAPPFELNPSHFPAGSAIATSTTPHYPVSEVASAPIDHRTYQNFPPQDNFAFGMPQPSLRAPGLVPNTPAMQTPPAGTYWDDHRQTASAGNPLAPLASMTTYDGQLAPINQPVNADWQMMNTRSMPDIITTDNTDSGHRRVNTPSEAGQRQS